MTSDDMAFCHHGSTLAPPVGLSPGDVITGDDGRQWAFTSTTEATSGTTSTFVLDQPIDSKPNNKKTTPSVPRKAKAPQVPMPKDPIAFAPLACAALLDGIQREGQQLWFHYSPELLTKRIPSLDKDGNVDKEFKPFHLNGSSPKFTLGNGPAFWPLWFQSDLHDLNNAWIVEPEGEVCANYVRVGGVVATSQPGHSRSIDQRATRYTTLKNNGCAGVVYLADNDDQGRTFAKHAEQAATKAGLPCVVVHAEELHSDMPPKGSIDDLCRPTDHPRHGLGVSPADAVALILEKAREKQQTSTPQQAVNSSTPKAIDADDDDLALAERITIAVEELLEAKLKNDASEIDAAFAEIWKLGVSRDRAEERILMLWASRHGLDISTGSAAHKNVRGRVIGQAKEGKGLRQQLPGFGLDNDLHLVVSDAGAGKTTALCELATVMSARDKGFLDHEAPRTDPTDDPRTTVLVIASDGEGSAYSMWEDYLATINGVERGAKLEVWAQDDDTGEASWNVSIHNMERLIKRMAEGDVVTVVMDTANAIFRGAGINVGTGPIETYLRLLKQIVCRTAPLWISQHTNRNGGTTMKSIGGHPAFQEVPSVVHLIECKDQADGTKIRVWHVLKLRGSGYRRFSYSLEAGELKVTDGHFFQNCREQVLITIHKQILVAGFTSPSDLARITGRPQQSIYNALDELRSLKLVRPKGRAYRLTAAGERELQALEVASNQPEEEDPACPW